nr:MAG TPA: helix-turn-helix domain protein [Caudoviricetes sp.]
MEETTKDFFDQQKEKDLLVRTGRTRPLSKPGIPTQKEWEAQNGPVVTKALPTLPNTAARLRWLKARDDLTRVEMARKVGFSTATLQHIFAGGTVRMATLRDIANAFDVPPDWFIGGTAQPEGNDVPAPKNPSTPEKSAAPKFRFELAADGEYSGAELRELVGCLVGEMRYSVTMTVHAEANP